MLKTPVSVLQEFVMKNGTNALWDVTSSEGPSHNPIFTYSVKALNASGIGRAHSKKEAKQLAAQKCIEMLLEQGHQLSSPTTFFKNPGPAPEAETERMPSNSHALVLNAKCGELGLSTDWRVVGDTGPSHARLFEVEVRVGELVRTARATTKRGARQEASRLLLQELQSCPSAVEDGVQGALQLQGTVERYLRHKIDDAAPPVLQRLNLGRRIADYHKALAESLASGGLTTKDLIQGWAEIPAEPEGVVALRSCKLPESLPPLAPALVFAGAAGPEAQSRERAQATANAYIDILMRCNKGERTGIVFRPDLH